MDVRRFSFILSLEVKRSELQLVTIKTKQILSTIATLEKLSCTLLGLLIISLYRNSSELLFPGLSFLGSEYIKNLGKVILLVTK